MPDQAQPKITSDMTAESAAAAFSGVVDAAPGTIEYERMLAEPRLAEALQDLREARDEAREEEFPEPSDTAIDNAERLLQAMYSIVPQRFEVYPTPDGAIAIDAPSGYGRSFIVFCESSGGALCMVDVHGEHRHARYDSTRSLPDEFIAEALTELADAASRPR